MDPMFTYIISDEGMPLRALEVFDTDENNVVLTPDMFANEEKTVDKSVIDAIKNVLDRYIDIIEMEGETPTFFFSSKFVGGGVPPYNHCNEFMFDYKGNDKYISVPALFEFQDKQMLDSEGNTPVIPWKLLELLEEIKNILLPQGIDPIYFSLTMKE